MSPPIQVGDTVLVSAGFSGENMYGESYIQWAAGRQGVVVRLYPMYPHWGSGSPINAILRVFEDNGLNACNVDVPQDQCSVVVEGPGKVVLGETHPFSPNELRQQRWAAWEARCLAADTRHQGWSNTATFLAHLYLTNEARLVQPIRALRRKDGSINPNRLAKLFHDARLAVDPWALEPPIEVPEEFKDWVRSKHHQWVNWGEVAAQVACEIKETS